MSSPTLLDYPCWIFMVYRGSSVKTRISVGPSWKSTCIQGKLPSLVISSSIDLQNKQSFMSAFHAFEDALLHFVAYPNMKEYRQLLGLNIIENADPEQSCVIVASHKPTLSLYDFQKICSVLCAYRFFEIVSLKAHCIPRIPSSAPTVSMFLPGPPSAKEDLDVSMTFLPFLFSDSFH